MKKNRTFLSITLSCFMFFTVAYAVSSSFFLFAKEADAQTTYCNGGLGTCYPALACPLGSTRITTCFNAARSQDVDCCFGGIATPPVSACDTACYPGGCPNGMVPKTTGNTVCEGLAGGGTCCEPGPTPPTNQPAPPTEPITAFVCNANVFTGGLVQCGKRNGPEDCTFEAFICLLRRIMNFLLFVLAVPIAAISFAWAGWLYLSAAGNESKIKQAHEIFGTVALGLCLALAAWLIVHAIVLGLGVSDQYNFLGN